MIAFALIPHEQTARRQAAPRIRARAVIGWVIALTGAAHLLWEGFARL